MTILGFKVLAVLLIFAAGWLGGTLPLWRKKARAESLWLSCGNALSAGIFLGIGLIHLLPDADAAWRELGFSYPVGFALATAAFAVILLFEHVLLPESAHAMTHAHAGEGLPRIEPDRPSTHGYVYGLLLGLSFHSVLAGIALGLQPGISEASAILVAILAHKATEGLALGLSLARSPGSSRSRSLVTAFALTTPAGVLVGLLARSVLEPGAGLTFDALVSSLAAGTFFYIASMDMLQDELLKPGSRWAKWLLATLGLVLTGLLAG
ncbi:MAG: ZIP family transporter [Thermoanaerobaculia bacterium]